MSADNGIYIAQFDDGYRVIHAQAIENVLSCEDFSEENTQAYIWLYFHKSPILDTKADAWILAKEKAKSIESWAPLEYGISELGHFGKMPEMTLEENKRILNYGTNLAT